MEIEGKYIYEVYTTCESFQGCGSVPACSTETWLLKTENRELAKQVFVFHLTGVPPGEYIKTKHIKIAREALRRFDD
jgi:hypothetical protein